jgi:hypothetical protein
MSDSVGGGARIGINSLSAVERNAAIMALSKLTSSSSSKGLASVFGGSLKSATLKGGTVHGKAINAGVASLATGKGSDTIVAGSAFHKAELSAKPGRALSSDTINVAGKTAAVVKASIEDKSVGHTITMADKTSITLIGVTPHTIKPH